MDLVSEECLVSEEGLALAVAGVIAEGLYRVLFVAGATDIAGDMAAPSGTRPLTFSSNMKHSLYNYKL